MWLFFSRRRLQHAITRNKHMYSQYLPRLLQCVTKQRLKFIFLFRRYEYFLNLQLLN